jgi:hypothetical protein
MKKRMMNKLLIVPLLVVALVPACARQEQPEVQSPAETPGEHTMADHDSAGAHPMGAHRMGGMMDDPDRTLPAAEGPTLPAGWEIRLDRASAPREDFRVRRAGDGFVVVNGPAGILYRTADPLRASGDYTITATVRQLERLRHREGYGLFFGGQDLQGPNQRYGYFLVGNDGKFIVKRREGGETFTLVPWQEHPAVREQDAEGRQENTLAVRVAGDDVIFFANGTEVARVPREQIPTESVIGYRVNHNLKAALSDIRLEK